MKKARLDALVFERGLCESRERAKTTVMAGLVYVNGQKSDKPGAQIPIDAEITVKGSACPYVSRGGFKLEKAIKVFRIDSTDKICLDCGASTGGFTDVLLQNGAAKVYAVDVGYGQLAWKLRQDERVVNLEKTNARFLDETIIPEECAISVTDASFISLKLLLPAICKVSAENADIVCLIKPQFEAGREEVGKHGVVRDSSVHARVCREIIEFASEQGLICLGLDYSPIKGPEGNIEFIVHFKKSTQREEYTLFDTQLIDTICQSAGGELN